ncbi:DUF2878 domain-containing protein [Amphritea opalescens]|uniref:DUF2878 domain-containing protein n=1 Tax=Amphritea opalescens TaxID=2490544 RepID=A0A430KPL5_9GAMM|nr:DUF2878 domain-containing protein [Amphritea opalescens]RTE65283.1 DUF2878 domain-containing protein [Amphritea opalescens]
MNKTVSEHTWVNLLGFQLAWWCAILYTSASVPVLILLLMLHLLFHSQPLREFYVLLLCGLIGFAVDMLLTTLGIFRFELPGLPLWLLFLWFCFAATLRQSLAFFASHLSLASLCGGLFGSLTYLAAANLEAVTLGWPLLQSGLLLMLIWMVLFPLLIGLSNGRLRRELSDAA